MEPGRDRCEEGLGWVGGVGQSGHSLQPEFTHLKGHPPGRPQAWAAPSATTPTLLRRFRPSKELA